MSAKPLRHLSLICLSLTLVACGSFRGAPFVEAPTRHDFSNFLSDLPRDLSSLIPKFAADPAVTALLNLPPGLPPLSGIVPLVPIKVAFAAQARRMAEVTETLLTTRTKDE